MAANKMPTQPQRVVVDVEVERQSESLDTPANRAAILAEFEGLYKDLGGMIASLKKRAGGNFKDDGDDDLWICLVQNKAEEVRTRACGLARLAHVIDDEYYGMY